MATALRPLLASLLVGALCLVGAPADAQGSRVDRARALFAEGQTAYDAGDFAVAAEKMKAAYDLTRSAELAFNVARVYERMSEYRQAIRYFRIYLRRGSPTDEARSDVRQRIQALDAARQRQRSQVFTAPPSTDALSAEARTFFLRGVAMFRGGHYEAAMQAFTAAHRFAPLPEVLYNMAITAERLGSRRDAIDYYREYLRLRPEAPDRGHVEREIARLRAERAGR